MKYLKLYNESENIGRDLTNYLFNGQKWVLTTKHHNLNQYKEIEKKYNINEEELSWILSEFVEYFNLLFKCRIEDDNISVEFIHI